LNYSSVVQFEWDDNKSNACFSERGFDFAYAASAFADPERVTRRDLRFDYGEDRFRLTGRIEDRLFVLIYTLRQNSIRIISARKANSREAKSHENRSNDD
jgi:uncharacterized DUF497 family protein